jgi:transposase InsO family protein
LSPDSLVDLVELRDTLEPFTGNGRGIAVIDTAVAESFLQPLKREPIRRRTYLARNAARQDVFDYIEMFYNPPRKHTNNGMLPPVDYEIKQRKIKKAGA